MENAEDKQNDLWLKHVPNTHHCSWVTWNPSVVASHNSAVRKQNSPFMARKTEKLKTIFAVVLESLASNISAIIGEVQQPGYSSPCPGAWLSQAGMFGLCLSRDMRVIPGGSGQPCNQIYLGSHGQELVVLRSITVLFHHSENQIREWTPHYSQQMQAAEPTGSGLFHRNVVCLYLLLAKHKQQWNEKKTTCPIRKRQFLHVLQTAAGLLLGRILGQCSSGRCFNKSLNST